MDEDVVAERKLLWVSGSSGGMQEVLWRCRIVDRDKVEILWVSVRVYICSDFAGKRR